MAKSKALIKNTEIKELNNKTFWIDPNDFNVVDLENTIFVRTIGYCQVVGEPLVQFSQEGIAKYGKEKLKKVWDILDGKPEVSLWRTDIHEAPKDGNMVLLMINHRVCHHVWWNGGHNESACWGNDYFTITENDEKNKITHWMEIPELPKKSKQ